MFSKKKNKVSSTPEQPLIPTNNESLNVEKEIEVLKQVKHLKYLKQCLPSYPKVEDYFQDNPSVKESLCKCSCFPFISLKDLLNCFQLNSNKDYKYLCDELSRYLNDVLNYEESGIKEKKEDLDKQLHKALRFLDFYTY